MRFATIIDIDDVPSAAVVADSPSGSGQLVVHPMPGTTVDELVGLGLDAALAAGAEAVASGPGMPLGEVTLGVPVRPGAVRDFVAFEEHVMGVRKAVQGVAGVPDQWYAAPTFYFTNPHSLVATGAEVPVPGGSRALDFELEVAAVVGRECRHVSAEEGAEAIFGYTLFNDWSARDIQGAEMQVGLGPCKGKDFATTLGPWVVTADELAGRHDDDGFLDLACTVEVNGEVVGTDLLSHMGWTFGALVAYAARDSVVRPGDVIGSGTVGHGGCLAELWGVNEGQTPPPLQPGDTVTITVEGIGSVTNTIAPGPDPVTIPEPRRLTQSDREARRAARGL